MILKYEQRLKENKREDAVKIVHPTQEVPRNIKDFQSKTGGIKKNI